MVESDGVAKALAGDQRTGDAAQSLTAILQTQYLRYLIIASWALGLLGTVGPWQALAWFVLTIVAGSVRGSQLAAAMNRRGTRTLRALDRIGAELSIPPSAVAIAWLRAQRTVVAPIVNVYAVAHVDELMQGVGAKLSRVHLAEIARAAQ